MGTIKAKIHQAALADWKPDVKTRPKDPCKEAHLVPEVVGAVRAGGHEGAVHRVEGDGVDGVDVRAVAVALQE